MAEDKSELDKEIEKQMRMGRSFTLASGLLNAGGGLLSGGSPIPLVQQAQNAAINWLRENLSDTDGGLIAALETHIKDKAHQFGENPDQPLFVLKGILQKFERKSALYELVRRADVNYGQQMGERPQFQKPGQAPQKDDPYTHESVQKSLQDLLQKI